jgi:solute carrier family 35 protein F5
VTSDYLYVLAMLKTTPLVVTIGLSLTIPLAVLGDLILGKYTAGQVIVGASLVLISFVAVGMDDVNIGSPKREGPRSETRVVAGGGWDTQSRGSLQDEADLT